MWEGTQPEFVPGTGPAPEIGLRLPRLSGSCPKVWLTAGMTLRRARVDAFIISWDDSGFRQNACMTLISLFVPEDKYSWRSGAEGASFFPPVSC